MPLPVIVPPATTEDNELVVFLSDLHVPHHDKHAIEAAIELIADIQPHRIVLNGDTQDFYSLSKFDKDPDRPESLQDEIDTGNFYRAKLRDTAPNAVIDETFGNHERRLESYLASNANALYSLHALQLPSLLHHKTYNINGYGDEGFFLRQNFRVKHGEFVRQDDGMSAKAQMLKGFTNGLTGHTHRLGQFKFKSDGGTMYRWFENGCLCNMEPDYFKGGVPNWIQGFSVGLFSTKSNHFHIKQIEIENGTFSFDGKSYGKSQLATV